MKKCPYCAEEIQDEAIKCRWCGSMLTDAPVAGQAGQASPAQSGAAGAPSPWVTPQAQPSAAQPPGASAPPSSIGQPGPASAAAFGQPPPATAADEALQYTHSGQRYLLGYGSDFFGIWDRQSPGPPIVRFPRTDPGWAAAWQQFYAWEPNSTDVGIGGGGPGGTSGMQPYATGAVQAQAWGGQAHQQPRRHVSAAWWLLPIFLSFIGGLIAWLVNKDADPKTARAMLILGIVMSAVGVLLYLSSGGSTSNSFVP